MTRLNLLISVMLENGVCFGCKFTGRQLDETMFKTFTLGVPTEGH